jgi:hypothetical protein
MDSLYGLKVVLDDTMTETVWVFPQDRFVEYEPKDEWWCRRYGIGHEETRPRAEAVRVGDVLYAHPTTFERISLSIKKLNETLERHTRELCEIAHHGPKKTFRDPEWVNVDASATASSFPFQTISRLDWNFLPAPSGERITFAPFRFSTREAFAPQSPCLPRLTV